MTLGFIALCAVVVAIVTVLWRVWLARHEEQVRATRAEAEAARWRKIGEGSEGVAHDVANLLSAAFFDLHTLGRHVQTDPQKAQSSVERVRRALRAVSELLNALRIDLDGHQDDKQLQATTEGHVRLQVALYRSQINIELMISGDLDHGGKSLSAARVIQNLFHNAVREAKIAGGEIAVSLSNTEFTIRNRIRKGAVINDSIYERGVTGGETRSSGLGLSLCREHADQAGWRLFHRIDGEDVTFICAMREPSQRTLPHKVQQAAPLKN
ncbi:MAG: HAMP domain-containing histidine kinase [Sandaracinaceae bacterium]|nr:HAMP domain-containing histidine kinase [Sandaracinaceae bacterium]